METFSSFSSTFHDLSTSALIQTSLLALIALLLLVKLVQRLTVKLPPGPFSWPVVGNWLQFKEGLNPRNLAALSKKYGDVCMLQMGQRRVLVVASPDMAKEVLQVQGMEFGSRARNLVFDMTTEKGSDLVFADYGDHWRKMRKLSTSPFFTSKVVQQSRHGWEEEVELALTEIAQMPGSTTSGVTVKDRLQLLIYNIVYRMMFCRRFEGLDDPLYVELITLNHENGRLAQSFKYNYGDYVPSFKPLLKGYLKEVWETNQRRLVFLRDTFLNERKRQTGEKVGVDFLISAQQKGEITESNVLIFIQNMNVAAIETTLWSSEWSIAELVNNQHIQEKLRNELDEILGKGVPITEPDVTRLPYLQAFVKEILRMHMVVPMLVPHMNLKAAKLAGYDIPAGTRILVNAWGIANDSRYWDKPEVFNPDRFLENKIDLNGNDFRFIPFGSGRRSCPGMMIALPILGLVLGRLVQQFELLPPAGVDKVDLRSTGGQLGLILAVPSRIILKPRSF